MPRVNPAGHVSDRITDAASEGAPFDTVIVYVCGVEPSATTLETPSVFVTETSAEVLTVVEVVFELLLPGVGSLVPSLLTAAVFESTVPLATEEATLTWTVKTCWAPAASPLVFEQVTACPEAEQLDEEPLVWKVVPAGSASETWKPPVLLEGPLLVTVSV